MPGVFIIEALAQTASVLVMHSLKKTADKKLVYFMSLENAKFRKPVMPNSKLYLYVKKKQHRGKVTGLKVQKKHSNFLKIELLVNI